MGHLCLPIKIPAGLTISFFLDFLNHLRFIAIAALTHLGLHKPPPAALQLPEQDSDSSSDNRYILILDGLSPSLVPVPIHIVTASIKNKLPVISCKDFLGKSCGKFGGNEEENGKEEGILVCTICLDKIGAEDGIRELLNCSHVFHSECLDTWVDEGQVTCPLCRSMLLPPKGPLRNSCAGGGPAGLTASAAAAAVESQLGW